MGKNKRLSIEECLKMGGEHYEKYGKYYMFPSKAAYLAYLKDYYSNYILPMSDEEYDMWLQTNQKATLDRLNKFNKYVEGELKKAKE